MHIYIQQRLSAAFSIFINSINKQYKYILFTKNQMKADSFRKKNFSDFKDGNEFVEAFKKYAETAIAQRGDRHSLRVKLFKSTQLLNFNETNFETKCSISKKRPKNQLICVVFAPCKKYHMFDLSYIYQALIKGKGNSPFKCPSCDVSITKTSDIQIDILSYHFYDSTEDASARLVFQQCKIPENELDAKRQQISKGEYEQTLVDLKPNDYTLVKLRLDIKSKKFIEECNKNQEINQLYERIIKKDEKWIDQLFNSDQKGLTKVSLVCPGSFRRIFNAVFHRNCKHKNIKNIIVFDLEYLIVQLLTSEDSNLKIKCPIPTCEAFFTRQNILEMVVLDGTFRQNLYKEPPCFALGVFDHKTFINKNQQTFIKQGLQEKLRPHLYSDYIGEIKKIVSRFWKTKYTVSKWNNFYKKLKVDQQFTRITIQRNTTTYPVRCRSCSTLIFMDLWVMVGKIYFNISQKKQYKCPIGGCKLRNDESNYQEFIYLDVELFKLMQLGINKVVFRKSDMKYMADINQISGDLLIQQIMLAGNYIKNTEYYYKENFNIIIDVKNPRFIDYYIPLILKSCLNKSNLISHIFYVQQKTRDNICKLTKECFKCNACQAYAQEITDLVYDPILHKLMLNENQRGYWLAQERKFIQKREKLSELTISDIKFKIKKTNNLPLKNEAIVNIINTRKQIIKFAVYSQKCIHPFQTVVFDLDEYNDYPKNMKCLVKQCTNVFEYIDEIEELSTYMNLLNEISERQSKTKIEEARCLIYKKRPNSDVGSFECAPESTSRTALFQTKTKLLPPIKLKSVSNNFQMEQSRLKPPIMQIQQPPKHGYSLKDKLEDLKIKYKDQYQQLPEAIQNEKINEWDPKTFNMETHGGIYIFNKGLVSKFAA